MKILFAIQILSIIPMLILAKRLSSLETSRGLLEGRVTAALEAQQREVSRQTNTVLSRTVLLQDRQSRLEQIYADCRLQMSSLDSRLLKLEPKEVPHVEHPRKRL